jgi:YVTN family beta-propeller protein
VAYLLDFATHTLDLVDLEHDTVALGLEPVGDVPNQIKVRERIAYVVNSAPEGLQIIDLTGPTTVGVVDLGPGTNPWAVQLAGNRAYVSLWGSDQVAVVDLTHLTVLRTIDVGVSPEGMCLAGNELYVANSGFVEFGVYDPGTVTVIDITTDQVVATIPVGLNAQWCAVDGEGEVHVVCSDRFGTNNGRVFVLDPVAHAPIDSLRVGGFPGPIAISPDGIGWMVEYGAGLLAIDTVQHTVLHDVDDPVSAGGLGALGLAVDRSGRVHVALSADGLLTVVLPDETIARSYAVGAGPLDVALYEAEPVPVAVTEFAAARDARDLARVELVWRLAGDDVAGCHVERRAQDGSDRDFLRLTDRPLEGEGRRYRFVDPDAGPGALVYRVIGVGLNGMSETLGRFPVGPAAPAPPPSLPALAIAARPNPATLPVGEVVVEVAAAKAQAAAEVIVFSITGRPLCRLHRGALAAGATRWLWDGRDERGQPAPAGVYVVRLVTGEGALSAKVTLIR